MNHRQTQKPPRYRVVLDKTNGEWDIQFGTTAKARLEDLESARIQEMLEGLELAVSKIRSLVFSRAKIEHLKTRMK